MPRYDTVSFLSDYGRADEFVGVVHSVLRSLAPHAHVIDVTHEVPAHDVRAGALCLARAAQYLCPGVALAVVDPGVGTDRRAIAVEVGEGQAVLVGPDNGVLAPAVAMVGGATRAVSLTNAEYQLPAPGATFAGRDVFAPAAAHLCNGVDLAELGELVDPVGNAQLNVDPDELEGWGERVQLRWDGGSRTARVVGAYGDLAPKDIGLVVDSYGLLSVSMPRTHAAGILGIETGQQVRLVRLDGDDLGDDVVTTPVELGRRS